MSVKELENLLHKAVNDGEFRKQLAKDPEAALKGSGIEVTPDRVKALKALSYSQLQDLAKSFGHPDVNAIQ